MKKTAHIDSRPCDTPGTAMTIGLLSNPHSGRNRKQLARLKNIVSDYPRIHHRLTASVEDIPAALADLAALSVDVLAINGGDGTIARVLTHLLQDAPLPQLPRVVLLPGGTTNMNAGDVGLHGSLPRAITRLGEWSEGRHRDCQLLERAILRVEPAPGQPATYGMCFGAGAIVQGTEYCHARIHTLGIGNEIAPGLTIARTIWGLLRRDPRFTRPLPVTVALDAQPAGPEEEMFLLLVSSLERLFLGIRPYWGQESGPLHATMIRHDARHILRSFLSVLRGRPNRHVTTAAGYRSHNVASIRLGMDGSFTLDGEIHRAAGPVTVSNGGELTFIRV